MISGSGGTNHAKPENTNEYSEINRLARRSRNPSKVALRLENGHFKSGEKARFKYWGLKALRTVAPYLSEYCNKKLQELNTQNNEEKQAATQKLAMLTRHSKTPLNDRPLVNNLKITERSAVSVREAANYINKYASTRYTTPRKTWVIPPYLQMARARALAPKSVARRNDWRPDPKLVEENLKLEYRVVPDASSVATKITKAREEALKQQQSQKNFHQPLHEKEFSKLDFNQQAALRIHITQNDKLDEYSKDPNISGNKGSFTRKSQFNQQESETTYETEKPSGFQGDSGIAHCQGLRRTMEDETLIASFTIRSPAGEVPVNLTAVFDGHGGTTGSEHAKKHLIKHLKKRLAENKPHELKTQEEWNAHIWNALKVSFVDLSNSIPLKSDGHSAGTTANVALQIQDKLWVANTGDSRAILVPPEGTAQQLSLDAKIQHPRIKPSIEKRDGQITGSDSRGYRVNSIGTPRALGDHEAYGAISPRPTITVYDKPEAGWKDYKLLQACDGLVDLVTSEQVGGLVQTATSKSMNNAQTAAFLTGLAYEAGSGDNISVMLTSLE